MNFFIILLIILALSAINAIKSIDKTHVNYTKLRYGFNQDFSKFPETIHLIEEEHEI